jgi:hypothetical protein
VRSWWLLLLTRTDEGGRKIHYEGEQREEREYYRQTMISTRERQRIEKRTEKRTEKMYKEATYSCEPSNELLYNFYIMPKELVGRLITYIFQTSRIVKLALALQFPWWLAVNNTYITKPCRLDVPCLPLPWVPFVWLLRPLHQ